MEEKIYEKIKNDGMDISGAFLRCLGIINEKDKLTGRIPKKNIDLFILLDKLGLIEDPEGISEKIDEFYDYLFQLGIITGISGGKKMMIEAIKNDEIDFDEIMSVNPEAIVTYGYIPTFISDLMEARLNEKKP